MTDAVVIGAAICVVGAVIVLVFLGFKIVALMKQDAASHKK